MIIQGIFYKFCIDPLLGSIRKNVYRLIESNSRIIDIASGTGALAMTMAEKCTYVIGIDSSDAMINTANLFKNGTNIRNIGLSLRSFSRGLGRNRLDRVRLSINEQECERAQHSN